MAAQLQFQAMVIRSILRVLSCTLLIVLVILVSGCTREKAVEKTKESRLTVFEAIAAPSGNVYTVEAMEFHGPYRYFMLSKEGRKTEIKPAVGWISKNITKNDNMIALRYEDAKKRYIMYKLSSRGKIIKSTPLPKDAFTYRGKGEKPTETQLRGSIADNEENIYTSGIYEFESGKGSRDGPFLKKVSPDGKVTDINTKHFISFVGNIRDDVCMAIDADNNLYISEWSPDTKGIVIERIDPQGRGEIVAEVPGGVNPDIINIDPQKNIFVGVGGMWVKYKKGDKKGVIIVSDEKSGSLRAKKPIKPKIWGDTGLWLMKINYMWRLEQ